MNKKIWNDLTKKEIVGEIDICLGRNDLSEINYTILSTLRYLVTNHHIPMHAREE